MYFVWYIITFMSEYHLLSFLKIKGTLDVLLLSCSFQRVISVFDNLTWSWTLFKNNLPIILLSWTTNYTCTHAHVRRVMYQSKYVFLDLRLISTQSGRSYPIHTVLARRNPALRVFFQRVYWTETASPDKRLKRHHALSTPPR